MTRLPEFIHAFDIEAKRREDGAPEAIQLWKMHRKAFDGEPLHPHGEGPFCRFVIPRDVPSVPGVYVFMVGDRAMYVGLSGDTRGLRKRLTEYSRIYGRQSFKGGPRTTCFVNAQIYKHVLAGDRVSVYVLPTNNFNEVEQRLIHDLEHPPWNLGGCKVCGHANGSSRAC